MNGSMDDLSTQRPPLVPRLSHAGRVQETEEGKGRRYGRRGLGIDRTEDRVNVPWENTLPTCRPDAPSGPTLRVQGSMMQRFRVGDDQSLRPLPSITPKSRWQTL